MLREEMALGRQWPGSALECGCSIQQRVVRVRVRVRARLAL